MRELTALARLAYAAARWAVLWALHKFSAAVQRGAAAAGVSGSDNLARFEGESTPEAPMLLATAPGAAAVAEDSRTIEGLVLPYGPAGSTSMGVFTFAAGSVELPRVPGRVKLHRDHNQHDPVARGTSFDEVDAAEADRRLVALGREPLGLAGTWGRFDVPEGPRGDDVLADVRNGLRDAFSVGVHLTPEVIQASRRAGNRPTPGAGRLREVSVLSVPAFEDALAAASYDPSTLVVAAWHDGPTAQEGSPMHRCPTCQAEMTPGVLHECPQTATANANATGSTTSTPTTPPAAAGASSVVDPTAAGGPASTGGPTPVAAAGGLTTVTSEAPVYTFDGRGASFVRDSFRAREDGDADAANRLGRFAAELRQGEGPTAALMLAAVETRATAPEVLQPARFDPTRFLAVIDRGRPMFTRLRNVTITDATPFRLPIEGDFDGVGVHTEGTAHVAEGTLTLADATVTPKAISGAYRVSRELVDASNPAIDRVALNAMTRDYRNATEDLIEDVFDGVVSSGVVADVMTLRAELIEFAGALGVPADEVLASTTGFAALANDVSAGDGRPMLPYVGPQNTVGTLRAGYTGASIDGVEIATAHRLAAGDLYAVENDGVMVGESSLLTFRFDQPEGPGIIKLALWAYAFAAIIRADSVRRYTIA